MIAQFRAGLLALLALFSVALPAAAAKPFRLCSDPDNPPLSSKSDAAPGIYVEFGRQIAAALARPLQVVWTPHLFADLGDKLRSGRCDSVIGLPEHLATSDPHVIFSHPLLDVGYAVVVPPAATLADGLAALDGKRVAVQFGSPPQSLLAEHRGIHLVTVMQPGDGMQALAAGKVDAAFLWGPASGWIDKTQLRDAFKVVPVKGKQLRWRVVMAFADTQAALRDAVDHALTGLADRKPALMLKYGLATAAPVELAASHEAPASAAPPSRLAAATSSADTAQEVATGHELFNGNCEHCHGHDAIQGIEQRNLRHLRKRYGDKMDRVFHYTVTHGRLAKGMPNWSGILTTAQFRAILAYLHSVQEH